MQLPKRRHELLRTYEEESAPVYLTAEGVRRLESELKRLETKDVKQAIEDVTRTGAFGDRSENAEYQEAKHRLSRTHARIFHLKERLKRIILIRKPKKGTGRISLGSTVTLQVQDKQKVYQIVGPAESSPAQGRISHLSPLGATLIGKTIQDQVTIETAQGNVSYTVLNVE